jgi:hypothetical protein
MLTFALGWLDAFYQKNWTRLRGNERVGARPCLLFDRPLRVVAFSTEEGWSREVTEEIASKLPDLSRPGGMLGATARDLSSASRVRLRRQTLALHKSMSALGQ